jgi:hypothetical protein
VGNWGWGQTKVLEAAFSWGGVGREGSCKEPSDLPSPLVTPLDVVKVRLQSQRPSIASGEYLNREPN